MKVRVNRCAERPTGLSAAETAALQTPFDVRRLRLAVPTLIVLALLAPGSADGLDASRGVAPYPRAVVGAAEGLPSHVVARIVPSRTGHLWVGTPAGFAPETYRSDACTRPRKERSACR